MKLSVIIPAYNREETIRCTIDSVLSTGLDPLEIVVVDDGSTDRTADVVREFGSRVRYLFQTNSGPAIARNTGFAASRGRYVAFLDSDDHWFPEAVRTLIKHLDYHQEIPFIFGDALMGSTSAGFVSFTETFGGNSFRQLPSSEIEPGVRQFERRAFFRLLLRRNVVFPGSLIMRREIFEQVGPLDKSLFVAEDWNLLLRLALRYAFTYCDGISVSAYCRHTTNLTNDDERMNLGFCKALERLLEEPGLKADERAHVLHHLKRSRFSYAYPAYDREEYHTAGERFLDCLRAGFTWKPFFYWIACQFPPTVLTRARHLKQKYTG